MNYSKFFPIKEYYKKYVQPTNPKRFRYKETGSKFMMVCPFHSDHDPSLGLITKKSGEELCHCFGCNYISDVVGMHKKFVQISQKRYISNEDAVIELCSIFGVKRESLPVEVAGSDDKDVRQEYELEKVMEDFDIGDFKYYIQQGKRERKPIGYFNSLLMIMVDKYKEH